MSWSPEAQKNDVRKRIQSRSIDSSRAAIGRDVLGLIGERVERIVAERPVERVIDVEAVDVPIARPAQVDDVERVRLKDADGIGADQEAVVVELEGRLVVIVVHAALRRVAGEDEVLVK